MTLEKLRLEIVRLENSRDALDEHNLPLAKNMLKNREWAMQQTKTSLYDDVKKLGCEIGNHCSDLYFPKTPETTALIRKHYPSGGHQVTTFTCQLDGTIWYSAPFEFLPWWDNK